jgi:hypothetical protein
LQRVLDDRATAGTTLPRVLDRGRPLDLDARVVLRPGLERAGLGAAGFMARRELEAAGGHARSGERDGERIPVAGRELLGQAGQRQTARRCVDLFMEVAGVAGGLAEAAGEPRRRAICVSDHSGPTDRRHGRRRPGRCGPGRDGSAQQRCRPSQQPSPHDPAERVMIRPMALASVPNHSAPV